MKYLLLFFWPCVIHHLQNLLQVIHNGVKYSMMSSLKSYAFQWLFSRELSLFVFKPTKIWKRVVVLKLFIKIIRKLSLNLILKKIASTIGEQKLNELQFNLESNFDSVENISLNRITYMSNFLNCDKKWQIRGRTNFF